MVVEEDEDKDQEVCNLDLMVQEACDDQVNLVRAHEVDKEEWVQEACDDQECKIEK